MATIDYKEKYEQALEVAQRFYNNSVAVTKKGLEDIFPELKESDDERIRKALIEGFKVMKDGSYGERTFSNYNIPVTTIIAWLEKHEEDTYDYKRVDLDKFDERIQEFSDMLEDKPKPYWDGWYEAMEWIRTHGNPFKKQGEQKSLDDIAKEVTKDKDTAISFLKSTGIINEKGELADEYKIEQDEQKPTNEVEPKFKIGDWVIDKQGIVHQIANVIENVTYHTYGYDIVGGGYFNDNTEGVRLWTIQDAKDGDVLATKAGGIFIYKELLYDKPFAYCGVDKFGVFKDCNCGDGLDWTPYLSDVTPATKEQRDTLEKAMADAGYTFDFDKKELKKIEQKPQSTWKPSDEQMEALESATENCAYSEYQDCLRELIGQ